MPIKNTAVTVTLLVWDFGNNCGKTGQEANITLRAVGDLTEFTPSLPAIEEIDATNLKGQYLVSLIAAENNYDVMSVGGILTVPVTDCEIIPSRWVNDQIDFNITQKASINTEVDTALNTAIPALPTEHSINERVKVIDDKVPSKAYLTGTDNSDGDIEMDDATGNYAGTVATVTTLTNAPASNADITSILGDTNELQGLISSSKIASQVKGMDANVLTASALATDAVAEIIAAFKARTIDGTITGEKMDKILLAFTVGKVVITTNSLAFYDQSSVLLFTLPITLAGRIPVIA